LRTLHKNQVRQSSVISSHQDLNRICSLPHLHTQTICRKPENPKYHVVAIVKFNRSKLWLRGPLASCNTPARTRAWKPWQMARLAYLCEAYLHVNCPLRYKPVAILPSTSRYTLGLRSFAHISATPSKRDNIRRLQIDVPRVPDDLEKKSLCADTRREHEGTHR
jgi:hypothetical protein